MNVLSVLSVLAFAASVYLAAYAAWLDRRSRTHRLVVVLVSDVDQLDTAVTGRGSGLPSPSTSSG